MDSPPERSIVSEEGLGMPPIDYVSQRGPFQHGETLRDLFLKPRSMVFVIRHEYCNRAAYWLGRKLLLDTLAPVPNAPIGPPGQGTLRRIHGMMTRDIKCVIESGPAFAARKAGVWDEFAYNETLKFTAYDPIWFDPVSVSLSQALGTSAQNLVFPITFPIQFGTSFGTTFTINYAGDWLTYPIIKVNGPSTSMNITNNTTGQTISILYNLPDLRFLTIDLTFGVKSVVLDDGTNLIGSVVSTSDLALWHLAPGANSITVTGGGNGVDTSLVFTYLNRYIGI